LIHIAALAIRAQIPPTYAEAYLAALEQLDL
jgi:hypothetical protein